MAQERHSGSMAIDRPSSTSPAPRWSRLDWAGLGLVIVGAAGLRLVSLGRPITLVFDEIFYAQDACWYVTASETVCGISELTSRAHPPLGKWLIGTGIATLGYDPTGWRITAAIAGIVTVALAYLLARRLLSGTVSPVAATAGATAAAGLLAIDFLHLVQSRIAMLDVFITMFVVAAVLFVVLDRDRSREAHRSWAGRLTLGRPWRLAAGAAIGAATAVKWSGAYVGLAVAGLVIAWAIAEQRRRDPAAGWAQVIGRAVRAEAIPSVVLLGVVPVLVYIATYTGRMPGELIGLPWREGTVWRNIFEHQRAMLEFHVALGGSHPYESEPWSWPMVKRPVAYYFADEGGTFRHILAFGNPLAWWPGVVALVALGGTWLRRVDWMRPEPVVLAAGLATYLPWLVLSGPRSQVFLWYLLPTIPFICVALGIVVARAWRWTWGRAAASVYGAVVVASFLFFVPVLGAVPVDSDDWWQRIWFRDCVRPGEPTLQLPDDEINQGPPPDGWCWI